MSRLSLRPEYFSVRDTILGYQGSTQSLLEQTVIEHRINPFYPFSSLPLLSHTFCTKSFLGHLHGTWTEIPGPLPNVLCHGLDSGFSVHF